MRNLSKYKGIIPAFYACYDENGNDLGGDGTHPTRLAYEKFYVPLIEAKLKSL